MSTPLSPAAQAVMDAFVDSPIFEDEDRIAAVLRAAAGQIEDLIGDTEHPKFSEGVLAVAHFLDLIAAKLERADA